MNQPPMPGYPPQQPGYPPQQPRRGKPWWVWLLGGCAGCAVLAILVTVIVGVSVTNAVKSVSKDVGPVTMTSVQQSLDDVPTYPGATLDEKLTQGTLVTYRTIERMIMHREPGSVFQGVGAMYTSDSPDKVLQFYDSKLKAGGWTPTQTTNTGMSQQHQYQRQGQMVVIQAQNAGDGRTMVLVIRGGKDLAKGLENQRR